MSKWQIPGPMAAIGKMLDEIDAKFDDLLLPKTPKDAEIALLKAALEVARLEDDLATARANYRAFYENFLGIRLKQLQPVPEPAEPTQAAPDTKAK